MSPKARSQILRSPSGAPRSTTALIHAAWWAVLDVDEHPYAQIGEVFFELDFDFLKRFTFHGIPRDLQHVRIIGKRRRLDDAVFFLHRWNRVVFAAATRNR